jgi:hypothetical protein
MYWVMRFFTMRRTFFLGYSDATPGCTTEKHDVTLVMGRKG